MKKVFIYNSSLNKNSRIYTYVNNLVDTLKEQNIQVFNNNALNTKLEPHDGTTDFYETGVHHQDFKDDGNRLKDELLDCDLMIFVTPVFCHYVSSPMAVFIERIFSLWVHLFKLVGKPCIIITTSESNGNQKVEKYLTGIIETLGSTVVDSFHFMNVNDDEAEIFQELKETTIKKLSEFTPAYSFRQESIFKTYKSAIGSYNPEHYEYQYWKNNHLFSSKSLEEYGRKASLQNIQQ